MHDGEISQRLQTGTDTPQFGNSKLQLHSDTWTDLFLHTLVPWRQLIHVPFLHPVQPTRKPQTRTIPHDACPLRYPGSGTQHRNQCTSIHLLRDFAQPNPELMPMRRLFTTQTWTIPHDAWQLHYPGSSAHLWSGYQWTLVMWPDLAEPRVMPMRRLFTTQIYTTAKLAMTIHWITFQEQNRPEYCTQGEE